MSRNNSSKSFPFVLVSVCLLAGCGVEPATDRESTWTSSQPIGIANGLRPEALPRYADIANEILSAQTIEGIADIADASEDGDAARRFLEYAVGCAFRRDQSLSIAWTGEAGEERQATFHGDAALAPAWAEAPLDEEGQRWVSACLVARTNWYGAHVDISMRGAAEGLAPTDDGELSRYPTLEGAFWGNLFADTPYAMACHVPENAAVARRQLRDCAAGHVEDGVIDGCGVIERVGSCADVCEPVDNGGYHPGCAATSLALSSPEKTEYVITVFLP
jgi:hypothetical protein